MTVETTALVLGSIVCTPATIGSPRAAPLAVAASATMRPCVGDDVDSCGADRDRRLNSTRLRIDAEDAEPAAGDPERSVEIGDVLGRSRRVSHFVEARDDVDAHGLRATGARVDADEPVVAMAEHVDEPAVGRERGHPVAGADQLDAAGGGVDACYLIHVGEPDPDVAAARPQDVRLPRNRDARPLLARPSVVGRQAPTGSSR